MADLNDINAAQSVKIIGSDSTGAEKTPVDSTINGALHVNIRNNSGIEAGTTTNPINSLDILQGTGTQGALTVGITAVEIKVGASRFTGRKQVTLYNNSNETLYWGFTDAVTTATGTPIDRKEFITWTVSDNTPLWIIAGSAGNNTRITEAS
jgi:hypothetical protein